MKQSNEVINLSHQRTASRTKPFSSSWSTNSVFATWKSCGLRHSQKRRPAFKFYNLRQTSPRRFKSSVSGKESRKKKLKPKFYRLSSSPTTYSNLSGLCSWLSYWFTRRRICPTRPASSIIPQKPQKSSILLWTRSSLQTLPSTFCLLLRCLTAL